jgi:hypothetical protein
VRQSLAGKDVNTEAKVAAALEAFSRQPVYSQQTENIVRALVNVRIYELVIPCLKTNVKLLQCFSFISQKNPATA